MIARAIASVGEPGGEGCLPFIAWVSFAFGLGPQRLITHGAATHHRGGLKPKGMGTV